MRNGNTLSGKGEHDMNRTQKRRGRIRIYSFLAFFLVVFGVSSAVNHREAQYYKMKTEYANELALNELGEYADNLSVSLNKGLYVTSPEMAAKLSTSLWRESCEAKNALSRLPLSEAHLDNTYKYLSQVGDFALSLSRKVSKGERITEEEHKQLETLLHYADVLAGQVTEVRSRLDNGQLSFDEVRKTLSENKDLNEVVPVNGSFSDLEQAMVDYPTLLYDGPFSDHISRQKPRMTENKRGVTRTEAALKASKITGIPQDKLQDSGEEEGIMPCYNFTLDKTDIAVTKQGGYLCYILNSRYVGESTLSPNDAVIRAKDFLKKMGVDNLKESYYSVNDGVCTVNLAKTENGVILYPDLIKVSVALDNGEILSLDARGYLMNHRDRKIPEIKISKEEAQSKLSSYLTVKNHRAAIIPTDSAEEKFCHEFLCEDKSGNEVLIYINGETGAEENILLLLRTDGGIFTK